MTWIEGMASNLAAAPAAPAAPVAVALALAVLLGLRHATDPDHLTAVATLMVSDRDGGARRAGRLGFAWGLGHAVTLFLFGLPLVVLGNALPERVHQVAEVGVGALIVVLAARLLWRWRRGWFHTHAHEHDGIVHAHPHFHEGAPAHADAVPRHRHRHAAGADRSPAAAFGVGLVHGVGGSAGAGVLMIAALSDRIEAVLALLAFAGATALSMAVVSAAVGHLLARGRTLSGYVERAVPTFGMLGLAFGVWYAMVAVGELRH